MKVPFFDLTAQLASIRAELDAAVAAVFDTGAFILGDAVAGFERAFAPYVGRAHCVGLNSGTSALHLALVVAGIGAGDEVITTPHTWISTAWAISYCGARPVLADIDARTGCLDPRAAAAAIGPRTRAVIAVDLYGNPSDLTAFERLCAEHRITLIEDAAQSHGARLGTRPAGGFGRLSCFSFYPGKNLGAAGEGGAIGTDDAALAQRLRQLRDHAQDGRHHHVEIGYNYRMEGLQGAVLGVKLRHLDRWNAARRRAAARYQDLLGAIPDVTMPLPTAGADPVWHLYVVRVPRRDHVAAQLADAGVGTGVHYPTPIHLQPAYAGLGLGPGALPRAEAFAAECLSLPMFPEITEEQQAHVATALRRAVEAR